MKSLKKINPKSRSLKACLSGRQRFRYIIIVSILMTITAVLFTGCQSDQTGKKQQEVGSYYTCSMHHQIHEDEPGNCPICGMKLIKVTPKSGNNNMPLDSSLSYLTQAVTKTVVGSFKVIEPVKTDLVDTLIADGTIGFDQRDVNTVNTRVTGRIDKLYISYTNQRIHKGQPLMEIYSPELLHIQRNLLQAMQDKGQTLISSLKEQLINLGMRNAEIQKVMQSRQPLSRIIIYSSYTGISQQTNMGGSSGMMMNTSYNTGSPTELLNIREGMYVNRGQTVFSIQDINKTWAILNIFTEDIPQIQSGDPVSLYADADPKNVIKGRINFIPPYREQNEKTTRVRVYLNKIPNLWKIGTLIHGRIAIHNKNSGWYIPLSAVNDLGMHHVIWIQDKKHTQVFHAREVEIGLQTRDSIEILSGINPGDKIVEDAAYMVGSDSFIQ